MGLLVAEKVSFNYRSFVFWGCVLGMSLLTLNPSLCPY